MSGCECKRDSAQPEIKGIRPILKRLRTLAGFLFFCGCRFPPGGKNRISRKIKNVAEVLKVQLKIQNNS